MDELKHTYKQFGGTSPKEKLEAGLAQFTGTVAYHRWSPLCSNYVLTDGALYLATEAGAFWLMDAIASYWGKVKNDPDLLAFQCWELKVTGQSAILLGMNGNNEVKIRQSIAWTDFPLCSVKLFVERGEGGLNVILLPSEH